MRTSDFQGKNSVHSLMVNLVNVPFVFHFDFLWISWVPDLTIADTCTCLYRYHAYMPCSRSPVASRQLPWCCLRLLITPRRPHSAIFDGPLSLHFRYGLQVSLSTLHEFRYLTRARLGTGLPSRDLSGSSWLVRSSLCPAHIVKS